MSQHIPTKIRRELEKLPCIICNRPDDIEIDHIVSVANGGKTNRKNLQPLCRVCNAIKRDRKTNDEVSAWIENHYHLFVHKQKMRTDRLETIAKFGRLSFF